MKKYSLIILLILITSVLIYLRAWFLEENKPEVVTKVLDIEITLKIEIGDTFSIITKEAGLEYEVIQKLLLASKNIYDLSTIKVDKEIVFIFDGYSNKFKKLIYPIDTEEELYIYKNKLNEWIAERKDIEYEIRLKTVEGSIESSLYESALKQEVDIRAIIYLADVFAWSIDFAMGIKKGDTYKFIFEERYREGKYIMPGKIIAAKFLNDNKLIEGYYFQEGLDENNKLIEGYYDINGVSLQKIFLKNPVNFKYISSGYTTGSRYISTFNVNTGHRAIDYAAQIGTPIRAVGEGKVFYAGWNNQGYGNYISIRHNSIYTTNYAHLSRIYVNYGQIIEQGDIIGTVGSTGFSTGPHLHFEMVKNGTKINPATIDLPSDKSVSKEKIEEFKKVINKWQKELI